MGFERVSTERLSEYGLVLEDIIIPTRKTKFSAGYDLNVPCRVTISPGCVAKIPTGLKCKFPNNMVLLIAIRSSMAIKGLSLVNSLGVIDADFVDNLENEGHILIVLRNNTDDVIVINKGERVAQGIFTVYHTFGDNVNEERNGGLGSTGK